MIIYLQSKSLKGHAEKLKWDFNNELKEANDAKLAQKEEKDQVLDLKEHTDKTILKIETLKISDHFNMHKLRKEHNDVLNATKDMV